MNERRKWGFNPVGEKYGMLTVLSEAEKHKLPSGKTPRRFNCKCDCGNEKSVLGLHLVRGRIRSCGCLQRKLNGESKTSVCRCYKSMKERCSPNYSEKHLYFEKGITVCNEWENDYFVFKKWALENGFKEGLQLDRKDNSKGYFPENCRFVTNKINVNNRDNTFFVSYYGGKIAFTILCDKLNIPERNRATLRGRISRGWEHSKVFDTPIKVGNYSKKKDLS